MEHHVARNPIALHVDDIEAARAQLEQAGVEFRGDTSTPASATWPSSPIRTATR